MNDDLKLRFLNASETEKLSILLVFAVHLTILARGEFDEPKGRLEAFNETLHRIVSQALAMVVNSKRYPDDVFIDMLLAGAAHKGLTRILEQAFVEARASIEMNARGNQ